MRSAPAFGLGECFDGPTRGALIADLAPARLQGRYWAISANSWDLGYVVGPAVGGFVLAAEPLVLWPLGLLGASPPSPARSRWSGRSRARSA